MQINVIKWFCKIGRHDDSKTISWHASFPVRFARVLSALCLNSPLRGSDSGSGAETSQTSRRKPCYRQYDLFSNHYGCSYLHTTCTSNITHFICTWANRIHTTKVWALLFLHKWKQLLILHFSNNFQYFYKIATISWTILLYICSRMLLAFLLQGAHHTSHDIFFCAHLI